MMTLSVARMMVSLVETRMETEAEVAPPAPKGFAAALRRLAFWRLRVAAPRPVEVAGVARVALPETPRPAAPVAPEVVPLALPALRPVRPRPVAPTALSA